MPASPEIVTRMHSSRMCTTRCDRCMSQKPSDRDPQDRDSQSGQRHPVSTETPPYGHACENITFCFAGIKNETARTGYT